MTLYSLRSLTLILPTALALGASSAAATPFAADQPMTNDNPLLVESRLPFRYPRFDVIKNEHFAPAFEQGMAEERQETAAIAANPQPPTFENTVVALEKAGQLLARTRRVFFGLNSANTNPEMQKLQREMAPKLAAHADAITLDPALFARVAALYQKRDALGLDPESKRLLWRYHKDFVRAGATLSGADKEKLKALNTELATLGATFNQNVLKEVAASAVLVGSREELAGLAEAEIVAAADAAKAAGHEGQFLLRLTNTSGQPPLASLEKRALREKLMQASLARGSRGGEFDNRETAARIARLRAERAALLGYPNHAAFQLEEQTAGSVLAVNKLLAQIGPPALANARREAAEMQKLVQAEGGTFEVASWDWAYYAEKVRKARYAFDESQLRPYYELNRVLTDGVFYAAERLYGLRFKERTDLPVYEPSVRVFDVFDQDGSPLALFIADYYARPNKNGGAWASAYVPQSALLGTRPVIANHLNVPPPPKGEPTLLTHDEVRTAFHEFGHALHGMFSNVKYPRFAGTSVPRDFVEYPSQVNEMWASWPEVLRNYAKHYQTGAPIPQELLDKVEAASKFNQGFATTELVAANVIDQTWHQHAAGELPGAEGVLAFESKALADHGVDFGPVPPRYRSTYYSHIFAGGYSAGYYSYFWSEVLDASSVEWMKAHGGLTRENGDRFRASLLSRGGSEEAMTLFRNFTGGEPKIQPFLERRGLTAAPPDQPPAAQPDKAALPPEPPAKDEEEEEEEFKDDEPATDPGQLAKKAQAEQTCPKDDPGYDTKTDKTQHPTPQPAAGKALVYVLRPTMMGNKIQTKLAVDGQWVGVNRGHNYFFLELDPGEHYFCSKAENKSALAVQLEAGKTYYLEQKIKMGFMKARNKLALLGDQEGQKKLAKCYLNTWQEKKK